MIEKLMIFLKDHKGAISSLLGIIMAFPVNAYFAYLWVMGNNVSRENLEGLGIINFIAMVWYIMPSKIEIGGKIFTLKLED